MTTAECDALHQVMSEAIDGEASPSDRAALQAHVAACQACRNRMDRLSALSGVLVDVLGRPSAEFASRVSRRVLERRIAAAPSLARAAAVAALFVLAPLLAAAGALSGALRLLVGAARPEVWAQAEGWSRMLPSLGGPLAVRVTSELTGLGLLVVGLRVLGTPGVLREAWRGERIEGWRLARLLVGLLLLPLVAAVPMEIAWLCVERVGMWPPDSIYHLVEHDGIGFLAWSGPIWYGLIIALWLVLWIGRSASSVGSALRGWACIVAIAVAVERMVGGLSSESLSLAHAMIPDLCRIVLTPNQAVMGIGLTCLLLCGGLGLLLCGLGGGARSRAFVTGGILCVGAWLLLARGFLGGFAEIARGERPSETAAIGRTVVLLGAARVDGSLQGVPYPVPGALTAALASKSGKRYGWTSPWADQLPVVRAALDWDLESVVRLECEAAARVPGFTDVVLNLRRLLPPAARRSFPELGRLPITGDRREPGRASGELSGDRFVRGRLLHDGRPLAGLRVRLLWFADRATLDGLAVPADHVRDDLAREVWGADAFARRRGQPMPWMAGLAVTTTDAEGRFEFRGASRGAYVLGVLLPEAVTRVWAAKTDQISVSLKGVPSATLRDMLAQRIPPIEVRGKDVDLGTVDLTFERNR
jgi:hypothetical protein